MSNQEARIQALEALSDEELHQHFWSLANQMVQPLVGYAANQTTPSIERSVLLRMGFNSLQAQAFVDKCIKEGSLGKGAGAILMQVAARRGIHYTEAYELLLGLDNWQRAGVFA